MDAMTGRLTSTGRIGTRALVLAIALSLGIAVPQALAGSEPEASFTFSPSQPQPGETVTFTAASDPAITLYEWDLDNDGDYDDATGQTTSRSFPAAGNYRIGLRVNDDDTSRQTVTVRPVIQFSPSQPRPGDSVIFSVAASGTASSTVWDLDNDGAFDDDAGNTAVWTFGAVGDYTVRARVGSGGNSLIAEVVVPVRDAPPPAAQPTFLTPFPVVRITGRTTTRGALIRRLRVRGPEGAQALVRCKGKRKNCPKQRSQLTTLPSRGARFNRFERHLRAGARLRIIVLAPDTIGKFTRFIVRSRGRAPRRIDSCIIWGSTKPAPCSSFTAP